MNEPREFSAGKFEIYVYRDGWPLVCELSYVGFNGEKQTLRMRCDQIADLAYVLARAQDAAREFAATRSG